MIELYIDNGRGFCSILGIGKKMENNIYMITAISEGSKGMLILARFEDEYERDLSYNFICDKISELITKGKNRLMIRANALNKNLTKEEIYISM